MPAEATQATAPVKEQQQQEQQQEQQEQQPCVPLDPADPTSTKRILRAGSGPKVASNAMVSVHYDGYLAGEGGEKFDSSRDRGDLFSFTLGQGSVIKGWEVGIASMRVGEVCELLLAPQMAYGAAGSPPKIPSNATLRFVVEMFTASELDEPLGERLAGAAASKEEGNALFKAGQFAEALRVYRHGFARIDKAWSGAEGEQATIRTLKSALGLNVIAALLKTKAHKEAAEECDKILAWEPTCVKALFRLAQARAGLGQFAEGQEALSRALVLEPGNASLLDEVRRIKGQAAKAKQAESQMYARMFQ